jgi:hypothetical protein
VSAPEVRLAAKVEETLREVRERGIDLSLSPQTCADIVTAGFNRATLPEAFVLYSLARYNQPITVRGLMYRGQAAGLFPDTSDKYYDQTGRVILKLRRARIIPFDWIVDSYRHRLKPSSWLGLSDFVETAVRAYRKDLWQAQIDHVEIIAEKDAMTGVIEPVTQEFGVPLFPIRGQNSETWVWNIAEAWNAIPKPIYVYYLGDYDPHGLGIEASLKTRLIGYCMRPFTWRRIAITPRDFANKSLMGFKVKRGEKKGAWQPYLDKYGGRCVEVDALDPNIVRRRVRNAIERHINPREWTRLQKIEPAEREKLRKHLLKLS